MIKAKDFINIAQQQGFTWYAGVPCSILIPFINQLTCNDEIHYISSANEGDAIATIVGTTLAGKGQKGIMMMQNSGLGNTVNPITSLAHTFDIPLLIVCTLRGDPDLKDEPQHELMGKITTDMFELMDIPWSYFPTETSEIEPTLAKVNQYFESKSRPYALIVKKDTFDSFPYEQECIPPCKNPAQNIKSFFKLDQELKTRIEVLERVLELTDPANSVVIGTTGYTGREIFALSDRPNHIYMVGSMGCASSLGLGIAKARPDLKVVVVDGDGAALMRMGNFATLGIYGADNLIHLLLDNQVHDSTGAQATVSPDISFAKVAQGCGYGLCLEGNDMSLVDHLFLGESNQRAKFGHLKIKKGTMDNLPRPRLSPAQTAQRLISHLNNI